MKINTLMPKVLKPFYLDELENSENCFHNGDLEKAWRHLERAHVIGQSYPLAHSFVHWKMLQFGFATKNMEEILGQIPRLLVGGIKSFVGEIPVGNTGGANVPPLKNMPIEKDIEEILRKTQTLKR